MHTEVYESDPFTGRKGAALGTFDSEYRFERNDEFFLKVGSGSNKYRVIMVRLNIADGRMRPSAMLSRTMITRYLFEPEPTFRKNSSLRSKRYSLSKVPSAAPLRPVKGSDS